MSVPDDIVDANLVRVLEQMPDAVILAEAPSGRLLFANGKAGKILRHPFVASSRIEEYSAYRGLHPDGRPYAPEEWPLARSIRTGEVVHGEEIEIVRGDGSRGFIGVSTSPIRDADGEIVAGVVVFEDITDRRRTEDSLRESEERFRSLSASSPVGIFLADTQGRTDYTNARCQAICGFTEEEGRGEGWSRFVHPDDVGWVLERWTNAAGRGEEFGNEFRWLHRDGTVTWSLVRAAPIRTEAGIIGFVGTVEDITDRKVAEERLRERARLAAFNSAVATALTSPGTLEQILGGCVEAMVRHLDGALARIWTMEEGDELHLLASAGLYTHLDGAHARMRVGQYKIGRIAEERRPHLTNSVIGDPRVHDQEWAEREGIVAFAGYPLVVEDRLVGVMAMFSRQPLTDVTLDALASVAHGVAVGIERHRFEEALVESEQRFRALIERSSDAIALVDGTGTITYASPSTERVLGYRDEEFVGRNGFEFVHPDDVEYTTGAFQTLLERPGQPISAQFRYRHRDGSWRWIDATAVNLLGDPSIDAIVSNYRDVTPQRLAAEERERLLLAEREARAEADAANAHLQFLLDANSLLSESLEFTDLLERLARLAAERMADLCFVDLLGPSGSLLRVAAVHSDETKQPIVDVLRERYPPKPGSDNPAVVAARTGRTQWLADIPADLVERLVADREHADLVRQIGYRSVVSVPLAGKEEILGALTLVTTPHSGRRFTPRDVALVEDLARRAGAMLDNARLYEAQRHVAQTLQRSLLPSRLPSIPAVELAPWFQAAGAGVEVGGDFYDAFELGRGRWGVVIGDVCGRGPEAAAVSGMARYTIRAVGLREAAPSAVLADLNEALLRSEAGRFCTVLYGELRTTESGAVFTLARGGHPSPLVLRADGTVEAVASHGTLIGEFPNIELEDRRIELAPGDAILLYTDGVIERGKSAGTAWLAARLGECVGLAADAIARRIEDAVEAETAGHRDDDAAVLVLRLAGGGAGARTRADREAIGVA